ncbi:hypothetical protein EV174_004302 [Coemansia sp. RSA 2320]|nr:hypothetical protein EV174_004302 [Coemansia sp. RSA 2320]
MTLAVSLCGLCTKNHSERSSTAINESETESKPSDVLDLPPDSPYGWVVVLASFLFLMMAVGTTNSYGIYLQEYHLTVFPSAPTSTLSWIGSLQFGSMCFFGVGAGVLIEQYDTRVVSALGAIVAGTALLIASSCSTPTALVFTQGIILFAAGGYFMPYYFMPSFAVVGLDKPLNWGANISSILNAGSIAGRILVGLLADYIGPLNALFVSSLVSTLAIVVLWLPFKHLGVLVAASLIFGFTSGSTVSLVPVVTANLFGIKRLSSILGLLFFSYTLGTFVCSPVGGALLDRFGHGTNYTSLIIYDGVFFSVATLLLAALRLTLQTNPLAKL